jgi:hypothetical protein
MITTKNTKFTKNVENYFFETQHILVFAFAFLGELGALGGSNWFYF